MLMIGIPGPAGELAGAKGARAKIDISRIQDLRLPAAARMSRRLPL